MAEKEKMTMRLIDADRLNKKKKFSFQTVGGCFPKSEWFLKVDDLLSAPTIDAVPVVRCKDCQFWQRHTQVNRDYGKCVRFGTVTTRCNDFCSLGMKKSDE